MIASRDRLIVALDVPTATEAEALVARLGETVGFYKIGLELIFGGDGLVLAEKLVGRGKKVFLDAKLHDIPNTVAGATARIGQLGATFLTVHAYPQTMRAAQKAAARTGLRLLAVTVLTSADDADLAEAGYGGSAADLVRRRALQAQAAGLDGLVMSPQEAASIRALVGPRMTIVTPGVRPAGSEAGDQKRVMTPFAAIAGGADHLVVGRPITGAADPALAAQAISREIEAALAWRGVDPAMPPPAARPA